MLKTSQSLVYSISIFLSPAHFPTAGRTPVHAFIYPVKIGVIMVAQPLRP